MGARLAGYLRRHVLGLLARAVALSGVASAAGRNSVTDKELAPDSVGSSELQNNAVKASNVKNASRGGTECDDGYSGYMAQIRLVGFDSAPNGNGGVPPDPLPADGRREVE